MKLYHTAPLAVALAMMTGGVASAQTTTQTKVSTDTSVKDGVAVHKTKVVHVRKRKTHRPKKILGVKIGHKTVTHKTVKETTTSSDGHTSTTVTTK